MHPVTSIRAFASALIDGDDLDPVYTMLRGSGLSWEDRARWCMAYWMYYHSGTASWIVEGGPDQFWDRAALAIPKAYRGRERRHFRGRLAEESIAQLRVKYPDPLRGVETILSDDAGEIMNRVSLWYGFGEWIAFKAADMCSTVLGRPVAFETVLDRFYVEPLKGAAVVKAEWSGDLVEAALEAFEREGAPERLGRLIEVLQWMPQELAGLPNPYADGPLRIQEFETCLCKYKAHRVGRYHIGEDRASLKMALDAAASVSPLAVILRGQMA